MPPATNKTRRQKVEEKERAIVAATRQVFRDGVSEVKISAIAARANLAEGTVYLYFRNKNALMLAAVGDFYAELTADAQAAVQARTDTRSKLIQLAQLHFERVQEEWPLIIEAMSPYLTAPDYRETEVFALNRRYVEIFDHVIRDAIAAGDIRRDVSGPAIRNAFYGGLEHCARSARLRPRAGEPGADLQDFLSVFFNGIMDPGASHAGEVDGAAVVERLQRVIQEVEQQMMGSGSVTDRACDT